MYCVASRPTYLSLIFNFITYSQERRHLRKISFRAPPFQRKLQFRCSKSVTLSIFKKYQLGIGLVCHLELENDSICFVFFLIAHTSKKGKGYILWQLCKPAQAYTHKMFPAPCSDQYVYPEAPEIWRLLLWFADSQQAWFCRLDSGKRIPPASSEIVPKKGLLVKILWNWLWCYFWS